MCRPMLLASILGLFASAYVLSFVQADPPSKSSLPGPASKAASQPGDGNYIIGAPIRHKNLTIFPVLSKTEQNADRYVTLDEGLRAHTVEVIEVGANQDHPQPTFVNQAPGNRRNRASMQGTPSQRSNSGQSLNPNPQTANLPNPPRRPNAAPDNAFESTNSAAQNVRSNEVNRLMVVNRSGKPLYLMPGEVVVGGDQDRTIGEETTIASTGKPVAIDVYCVEHGRWRGRSAAESAPMYVALGAGGGQMTKELTDEAKRGYFNATAGSLNKAGRQAVQSGEGQGAVWENVQKINDGLKVKSDSGAFTHAYVAKPVRDGLEPYLTALSAKVAAEGRVVGAVVAINGKIESVDVFESTPLFRKLWPKLLKSYALDALGAGAAKSAAKESSVADASAFLTKVLQASVASTKQTKGGLVVTRRETKDATSYSAASPAMGGGGGGAIHASGFSK
jgi:hypothetical protein